MIRIDDLGLFLRSAALGSFTAAAVEADLLPGQVAASIKRLERELEVRLFTRTTRSLRLSAEGEQYLPTARSVLDHLSQGRENLRGDNAPLRGTLQIAAPSDLGRNILLPWLTEFRRLHPELKLRLLLSDQISNLFRDPVDVAVRYGFNEDANYIAIPLVPLNRRVLVASPDYLARNDTPVVPDDLKHHTCLPYLQNGRIHDRWQLGTQTIQVGGPLFSDDADVVRRWALEGEGIAYKSWLDVSVDVQEGRLVVLMTDHPGDVYPLCFACPHRAQLTRAVTRFHQWLSEKFGAIPPFNKPV